MFCPKGRGREAHQHGRQVDIHTGGKVDPGREAGIDLDEMDTVTFHAALHLQDAAPMDQVIGARLL
ncbi:MAG: hypothetical protein RPU64_16230 [Candidatus Sedimenticola sp. (ex Thyasira tokunagai)]